MLDVLNSHHNGHINENDLVIRSGAITIRFSSLFKLFSEIESNGEQITKLLSRLNGKDSVVLNLCDYSSDVELKKAD